MTNELMRIISQDGSPVIVEITDHEPGLRPASRRGALLEAKKELEAGLREISIAAGKALEQFRGGSLNPDGIEIEFGVRFNAEVGAVVAKIASEGHFTVKLSWNQPAEKAMLPSPPD